MNCGGGSLARQLNSRCCWVWVRVDCYQYTRCSVLPNAQRRYALRVVVGYWNYQSALMDSLQGQKRFCLMQ